MLDFVKRYYAQWGESPSLGEISAELGVTKQSAHELVGRLVDTGHLRREAGKRRGLELVEAGAGFSQGDALLRLRDMGWKIDNDAMTVGQVQPPLEIDREALTKTRLHGLPFLDHEADVGSSPDL